MAINLCASQAGLAGRGVVGVWWWVGLLVRMPWGCVGLVLVRVVCGWLLGVDALGVVCGWLVCGVLVV